jgi:succinyl-diaminopimelate desuccinylase
MSSQMKATPDAATLLADLIRCPSVTPHEAGTLTYIADLLERAGFAVDRLTFSDPDTPDVENLFASIGGGKPHLVFNGHTDVVPPGDEGRWTHPPFAAERENGVMFGRGAVDMKGGVACFLAATLSYLAKIGTPPGTLSFMITTDEEGPAVNGSAKLVAWARERGHAFDAGLVGEPTSVHTLGDTIKIGRRGSLSFTLKVDGKQGHVAYPHHADNPTTGLVRLLASLLDIRFDDANENFEASNLEITSIDVGNPVVNIIPASATARFNVRLNDNWTLESMEALIRKTLDGVGAPYKLGRTALAAEAFLTSVDELLAPLTAAITEIAGVTPKYSTGGGTSDARFVKDACPVIEFGLVGDTLHQVDERVPIDDLERLTAIYRRFLDLFFSGTPPVHARP